MYTEESKNFARYAEILKETEHVDVAEAFEALSDELDLRAIRNLKMLTEYMSVFRVMKIKLEGSTNER